MHRDSIAGKLYAAYAWCIGGGFTFLTALLIILLPGIGLRRRAARLAARGLLRITGIPLRVEGLERLPEGGCIVVANHASYLDGIILTAALPPRFAFVIKREITRVPLVSQLLHRLGSQFVDRHSPEGSRADAGRLLRSAANGTALGIFPEGTFKREPGIRHFKLGAFRAACRASLPVVSCGIRGSRQILPADCWQPVRNAIRVSIGATHFPQARHRGEAHRLLDLTRREIAELAGEALLP